VFVAATDYSCNTKINRNTALKMDAVTAANYKAGVTAGVAMELTLYSHFLIHQ
jgi:hypothetical protein